MNKTIEEKGYAIIKTTFYGKTPYFLAEKILIQYFAGTNNVTFLEDRINAPKYCVGKWTQKLSIIEIFADKNLAIEMINAVKEGEQKAISIDKNINSIIFDTKYIERKSLVNLPQIINWEKKEKLKEISRFSLIDID